MLEVMLLDYVRFINPVSSMRILTEKGHLTRERERDRERKKESERRRERAHKSNRILGLPFHSILLLFPEKN